MSTDTPSSPLDRFNYLQPARPEDQKRFQEPNKKLAEEVRQHLLANARRAAAIRDKVIG